MKTLSIAFAVSLLMVSMPGCASNAAQREADRLALYRAHAAAPVDSIQFVGSYNSWTPLGDTAFALWTRPSKAYLLEVYGPCMGLDFANAIGFRNIGGRLSARFDEVYVSGIGASPVGCQIKEIRPLDVKALKLAEKEARAKRRAEQTPQASGT